MPKALIGKEDRELVFSLIRDLLPQLEGKKVFLTGATGLFGKWLTDALVTGAERLSLSLDLTVLVRDRAQCPNLKTVVGNVQDFPFPKERFTDIVHLATPASAKLNEEDPLQMWDTIVGGMKHMLEFARVSGAKRILFTSSGAVYGPQPHDIINLPETYLGSSDPLLRSSAYSEGKRTAEHLCAQYFHAYGIETKIARCFAFVGPHLPLDSHFAAGNFLRDAISGKAIKVSGDGTPYRSYMYMADLVAWLLKIWLEGKNLRPYNVGSERSVTISELAQMVASLAGVSAEVLQKPTPGLAPKRYVPSTERARSELGLKASVELEEALLRTYRFYKEEL
jgi:nucleoside-diphosphate-sugar epimerase